MELKVIKDEDNVLEFKIIGERHSYPGLLKKALLSLKEVNFVSYKLRHPLDKDSILIVRTKDGTPKKALQKAVDIIESDLKEFEKQLKKI